MFVWVLVSKIRKEENLRRLNNVGRYESCNQISSKGQSERLLHGHLHTEICTIFQSLIKDNAVY